MSVKILLTHRVKAFLPSAFIQSPQITDGEAGGEWVFRIYNVLRKARNPGASAQRWNDGRIGANLRFSNQPSGEDRTQNAFVREVLL